MIGRGLILAAPGSGSGKTTLSLGLLRALHRRGTKVRGAKSGPDYIDPRFHEVACGRPSMTLDAWAMRPEQIKRYAAGKDLLLIEGAMGLFDGAPPDGRGAVADLARRLGLPVVLVVDAAHMAQSVAPLVAGFADHDPDVRVVGVILNKVGSPRHEAMLRAALAPGGIPVLGAVHRDPGLALPSRHLGLVQAEEHGNLDEFLDHAADVVEAAVDLDAVAALAAPYEAVGWSDTTRGTLRKTIAVARDPAFAFLYPHQIADWRHGGADIRFFSPLADDPVPQADWVYFPGGYPELHAERLAGATRFIASLRAAAADTDIYGECGGYMVLGESLTDAAGTRHRMAGLLGLQTSFATRRLHLGYRELRARAGFILGRWRGHEFHYATTLKAEGRALWDAWDAEGNRLDPMGLVEGRVQGSFAHLIANR